MKLYCPKCDNLVEYLVREEKQELIVKNDKIDTLSKKAFCEKCNERIFHHELDGANLDLAYSVYRKKHNLLSPPGIAAIRKKYGLSQRSLSRLLEWGEITIHRYESGAIQDNVHNEVLMFIDNPKNMAELFERNKQYLSNTARERFKDVIDHLLRDEAYPDLIASLEDRILQKCKVDEYSGFVRFNLEKMINTIVFIAQKTGGVFTTKLNKLLWYIDFLHYKTFSVAITGSNYIHRPFGPVPDFYDYIMACAIDEDLLDKKEVIFSNGTSGVEYKAVSLIDDSSFTDEETQTINFVLSYFKDFNCGAIKDMSHKEKAYLETEEKENISYKHASDLNISYK